MNAYRKTAAIAGILYIIGFIAGILSIAPAIDASDYLFRVSAEANQVLLGALFQFIMTIAYVGYAIILYRVLKKFNESLALGFLSFRIIAAILNIIGFLTLPLLLSLSEEFVKSGTSDLSSFQTLGDLLRSGRDFVNHVAMIITLSVGNLMFYFLLYRVKLIPSLLSFLGIIGTLFSILASLLVMFHIMEIITAIYIVLNLPIILLEIVLAIWFIAKGFNSDVINSITEMG